MKILSLYPNMMDLYGDSGNLQILKYRAAKRGIKVQIDEYKIGDGAPRFDKYDLVFMGGGSDREQQTVAADLRKYRKEIQRAIEDGVVFLMICGAYQLFGQSYRDAEGNLIRGLQIFDFHTEASLDKSQRCIGNVVVEARLSDVLTTVLVGFENHGGQTHGVTTPLGRVLYGNGNTFNDEYEGMRYLNFIGTYLHGPLLAKNPVLADYLLELSWRRRYPTRKLPPAKGPDDTFEEQARREMIERCSGRRKSRR